MACLLWVNAAEVVADRHGVSSRTTTTSWMCTSMLCCTRTVSRTPKTFAQEGWHYELENPEVT